MSERQRILILSAFYAPAIEPRAFRTTELARELARRGHDVTVFVPEGSDVEAGIHARSVPYPPSTRARAAGGGEGSALRKRLAGLLYHAAWRLFIYFLGEGPRWTKYALALRAELAKIPPSAYDVVIAIGLPFYVLAAAASCRNLDAMRKIGDLGDPFFRNPNLPKAFYFRFVEEWVLARLDALAIPIEAALPAYLGMIPREKLRIIPQGFRLLAVDPAAYTPHDVPEFCFAGSFYADIRDPSVFFDFLAGCDEPFRFHVYAKDEAFTHEILARWQPRLGDRLIVHEALPHDELIRVMARMDFVVNIDNDNATQRPSKLIDYAMSRRPILSFRRQTFDPAAFLAFLHGDYRAQERIDLAQYDIRRVTDQFEALF